MTLPTRAAKLPSALPFWLSLVAVPLAFVGAKYGGWWVILLPLYGWVTSTILDAILGLNETNPDPQTDESDLFWHGMITVLWFPVQVLVIFGMIWYTAHSGHLSLLEKIVLFYGVGFVSGSIGIVYAHELMHQSTRLERWLADLLLATVLYSHFRTEHLLVHHRYVGTPRDAVTARYNEGFYQYFPRVLRECPKSAWKAEKALLKRKNLPVSHRSNPFWKYGALQVGALVLAWFLGGWGGVGFFVFQSFIAIWALELTNYVEHYGLTRKHLGDGKYEHVMPHHSWNAAHTGSNWFLINLQRHSDHHYKPERRFALLQTYPGSEAPQLPFGYPVMTGLAMLPHRWRRRMNPGVRRWRERYYPEIQDWDAYKKGTTPMPG
jgi:alkane 1-monooxygenase